MNKLKHFSPAKTLYNLLGIQALSLIYLFQITISGKSDNRALSITLTSLAVIFCVASIVLMTLLYCNKELQKGDEFTTKILRQAGLVCFRVIVSAIMLFIGIIQVIITINKRNFDSPNDFLSVTSIMCVIAGIQAAGVLLYTLLVFIYKKTGGSDEK